MIGMLYRNLKLLGSWTVRVATLVLPREQVAAMLPPGLVLGPQRLTPRGTHPLRLSFATPFAARMVHWPPGFLGMHDYREHVIGIPFVYRSGTPAYGPFYFMPRLLLDNAGSALGGNMFWGFEKELCHFECRPGLFRARDLFDGHPLLELRWQPNGRWRPAQEARNFRPSMNITDQPLVFRTLWNANFTHYWSTAMVRSVRSRVEIHEPYVPHMPVGCFDSAGLRSSVNGTYELRVTWATSLPYYPEVRPLLQALGSEVF